MKTPTVPHHKAGGSKDGNETNWPVVISILVAMAGFCITFYIIF